MKHHAMPNKANTKPRSGYVTTKTLPWSINPEGKVTQTMCDAADPDIRLFTETASQHNQMVSER